MKYKNGYCICGRSISNIDIRNMGDKDLKKWVEKILNWIKSKKLTGVSTPLIGLTWEDKNIVKKIKKRKFVASIMTKSEKF